MRGRLWINSFRKSLDENWKESQDIEADADWTEFMLNNIIDNVGEKTKCYVVRRRKKSKEEYSGEYLNVDAFFIDCKEFDDWETKDWDPPVLPSAVVEHENDYRLEKITYCLWKILCIRAPVRVLICYKRKTDEIEPLRKHLEDIIWQMGLMKGTDSDLYVIVGDDSKGESDWRDYFSIFEWRNDRLEKTDSW